MRISVVSEEPSRDLRVLRIASASKNSVTQSYGERAQVSLESIKDLHKKIVEKLRLHRIDEVHALISMEFENDRSITFNSIEDFARFDFKIEQCANMLAMKWSFIFDVGADGGEHMHSIYVRISERPNAGLIFQKIFSRHNEDIESFDNEIFAPISCKVDFMDGAFSTEVLAVVTGWVRALPVAESSLGIVNWLKQHDRQVTSFIKGTFPVLATLAYVGIWLGKIDSEFTNSTK